MPTDLSVTRWRVVLRTDKLVQPILIFGRGQVVFYDIGVGPASIRTSGNLDDRIERPHPPDLEVHVDFIECFLGVIAVVGETIGLSTNCDFAVPLITRHT